MMNVVVMGGNISMNGSKRHPIVFVAQDKIYILEDEVFLLTGEWENRFCLPPPSDTQFEVFCPREKRWRVESFAASTSWLPGCGDCLCCCGQNCVFC